MTKRKAPTDQKTVEEIKRRGWRTFDKTEHWVPSFLVRAVVDAAVRCCDGDTLIGNRFHTLSDAVKALSNGSPGVRKDLFNFADYLVVTPAGFLFIQTTADSGMSARVLKIRGECADAAKDILTAGGHIEVWGWKQKQPRARWTLRRVAVLLADDVELYTEKIEP